VASQNVTIVQVEVWTLLSSTLPEVAKQQAPKLIPLRLPVRLCEKHCLDSDEVDIQVKVEFSWKYKKKQKKCVPCLFYRQFISDHPVWPSWHNKLGCCYFGG